jgi:hypothetical protein
MEKDLGQQVRDAEKEQAEEKGWEMASVAGVTQDLTPSKIASVRNVARKFPINRAIPAIRLNARNAMSH